ncbi:MAG: DNA primase [Spirochaetaceae bacterium]|nr:DNA primase [Spirochaetaceae bacterium]
MPVKETCKNEIINRIDALAIIGEYVKLEKIGTTWKACCPFHNEKTPSFTVNPDKKLYYCFGCQKGGDVINFVMEMDKLSFVEALSLLAKKTGVSLQFEEGRQPQEKAAQHKDELAELYQRVGGLFHYILLNKPEGRPALEYIKNRAISDETIAKFKLGYAPASGRWLFSFLQKKGYSPEFLGSSGLFSSKKTEFAFFRHRLIFPINDRYGKTVAFGGRALPPDTIPKYLNSSDSDVYHKGETLFAIDIAMPEIRAKKEAIICEGYMDVIALHQAGICNAVAPLGTAFTGEQAQLLKRWADRLLLLFDMDNAGQNAAVKAILTCRKANLECKVIGKNGSGQTYKDPADILLQEGQEGLTEFVKNTIIDVEFLSARSKALFNLHDSNGKARAVAYLFPFLETVESEVSRESCIKQIADEFEVVPESVRKDFSAYLEKGSSAFGGERERQKNNQVSVRRLQMNDELFLLIAVFVHCGIRPELFSRLRSALPIEEFTNPDAKELYLSFEEALRNGALTTDTVLSSLRDDALKNYLISKCASGEFSQMPEQIVSSGIKRIKGKRLEQKRRELISEMLKAKQTGRNLDDLLSEKMFIDERLQELENVN